MIYFDNAATTYPKPTVVIKSVDEVLKNLSFNSGRGGYRQSLLAAEMIYSSRENVADFFSASPENVIFTKNCTESLNIAIKGSVKKGDHVIISSLEHNSVTRVVEKLKNDGVITYDIAPFSYNDDITVSDFEYLIKDNTTLVVCTHSSNAFGVTFPVFKLGKMCKKHNLRFIVDAAQGAGIADINMKRDNIDILCAPGHKCLMGIMGTGIIAISDNINVEELLQGGTGSNSLALVQPDFSPDKFEAGTLNNAGIMSIKKGIDYIKYYGRESIYNHEMTLCKYLYNELSILNKVVLYTPYPENNRTMPIISFNIKNTPSENIASFLSERGICTRAGYHCTPLAHKHFKTLDSGTVRVSLGAFNNMKECTTFIDVVKKL